MNKNLKTKIIFVSFLIANNFTYLRCEEVCCDCCKECFAKLGFFSNDDNYKTYNKLYDNIINMIENQKFNEIRELYKEKISEIRKKISEVKIEFNDKNINNKKIECALCKSEAEKYDVVNGFRYCETCFPATITDSRKKLNKDIPYCIPKFNLLLTENKYLVLKVEILAIFVDKNNNLFIRGDWDDKLTYTEECYDNNNELFQKIGEGVFVYNYRKKERIKSNKACAYFVIGSKTAKGFNFYNSTFNFSTLIFFNTVKYTIRITQENSPDSYTYFSICFYLFFQSIYYGTYFEIDGNDCNNSCAKICTGRLHYYFDYSKKNNSCIKELLENDPNNDVNIYNNKQKVVLEQFLKNLHTKAIDNIPESIAFDFTFPKKILESVKKDFEKNKCIAQ